VVKRPSVRPHVEGKTSKNESSGAKRPRVWSETSRRQNFHMYGPNRPEGEPSRGKTSRQGARRRGGETPINHRVR